MTTLSSLNQQFGIDDRLVFVAGPGDLPVARVRNDFAIAEIALLGAHVLSYQPHDTEPVLWVSSQSNFAVGKPIRGGIPVCWPWFAGHPTDSNKPAHGFVRTALWTVLDTRTTRDDRTEIELGFESNEDTLSLWPHPFALRLRVTVGPALTVTLFTCNTGDEPFNFTGALHTYFHVGDAAQIAIHGLDGVDYLDKVDGMARKTQQGPVEITGFTDRVYLDTDGECIIEDPVLKRKVHIEKAGSATTVVWNPWRVAAPRLPDFADDEYPSMVCVETAKAADDVETIAPAEEHHLTAHIWVDGQ
ncbi:MAG: D-hexose-6-phosphate mutarotase [Caldilineaceae bacterium]